MTAPAVPAEDLPAALALVGSEIETFGQEMLEHQLRKARRHQEKYVIMPWYWVLSRRIRRLAHDVSRLDPREGETPDALASRVLDQVIGSGLPVAFKGSVLEAILQKSAGTRLGKGLEDGAAARCLSDGPGMAFHYLQARLKIEETLPFARQLAEARLGWMARRRFLRQPAALYLARDLFHATEPRALETVPGRIVYVAAMSIPHSTSGYATRTHGVATAYRGLGYDLHVVTRPPFPLTRSDRFKSRKIPVVEEIDGVPYHRLLRPFEHPRKRLAYFKEAANALEAKFRVLKPEYVIAGSNVFTALPALVAARRCGLPFAYEVRGFWELTRASNDPGFEETADFAVLAGLETEVAKDADKVLTLTTPMAETLIARGVDPARIALMPNGVDEDLIQDLPRDLALVAELGLPEGVPVIGYVGSVVGYEGLDDLAGACVLLSKKGLDFRLLIVGSEKGRKGDHPITDRIRGTFEAAGIADRLIMPGRVPFDAVSRYYSVIDIAPIPRKAVEVTELVSPIKPAEALALGKILIVSSVAALADFAQDGETGLVFGKGDVAELAGVLERAITDVGLAERLRAAGPEFIRTRRTWSAICREAAAHLGLAPAP